MAAWKEAHLQYDELFWLFLDEIKTGTLTALGITTELESLLGRLESDENTTKPYLEAVIALIEDAYQMSLDLNSSNGRTRSTMPSRPRRRHDGARHDTRNKKGESSVRHDARSKKGGNIDDWSPRPSRSRRSRAEYWQPWRTSNESGRTLGVTTRRMTLDQARVTCVDCMKHHRPIPTTVTPEQTSVPAPHTRARSTSHHSSSSTFSHGNTVLTVSLPCTISLPTAPTCITVHLIITIVNTLNLLRTIRTQTTPSMTTTHYPNVPTPTVTRIVPTPTVSRLFPPSNNRHQHQRQHQHQHPRLST